MKMLKKIVVAAAFVGLIAAPMMAMAAAGTGTANNTATYDTGVVYQNSTGTTDTTTQSLAISTDPLKGFNASINSYDIGGFAYENNHHADASLIAVGGFATGGTPIFGPEWGVAGIVAAAEFDNNYNGFLVGGEIKGASLSMEGSLNVSVSKTVYSGVTNAQLAAQMGSVDMTSSVAVNAIPGDPSGAASVALAGQTLQQAGAGQYAVAGGNANLYGTTNGKVAGLNIGGGYAAGAGGSIYNGGTFAGAGAIAW